MAPLVASLRRGLWPLLLSGLVGVALVLIVRSLSLGWTLFRPIPYWDHWEFIKSIPHIYDRSYALGDLFSQHNEHRIVTARLVFILDLLTFDGTGTLSVSILYLSLLSMAVGLACTATPRTGTRLVVIAVIVSFLLSPGQWENFASGFQVQFPFVDLFVLTSFACLIAALDEPVGRRAMAMLLAAIAFDCLAVFSMASGPLAIAPAILIGVAIGPRSKRLAAYLGSHAFFCALFFIGYSRGGDIALTYAPLALVQFTLIYLGSCLNGHDYARLSLGMLDIAAFGLAFGVTLRRAWWRVRLDRGQILALAMLAFIVLWAVVTAHGRASLGIDAAAASSRYVLQSILMQTCLFVFYWREAVWRYGSTRRASVLTSTALVLLLGLSALSNVAGHPLDEWRQRASDLDRAGFALTNGVAPDDVLKLVYPQPDLIREPLAFLANHRLSLFSTRFAAAFRSPPAAATVPRLDDLPNCTAQFGITRVGPTGLLLDGWIFEPTSPAADGWILVYDGADHDRLVGFGRQSQERKDVDEALQITARRTGFQIGVASPLFGASIKERPFNVVLIPWHASRPVCRALAALTEE